MKYILLFALLLSSPLLADDSPEIMENADMSDGSTHWHGDCKPAGSDMTMDFTSGAADKAKGIQVDLHSTSWTKVTQEIHKKYHLGQRMILTIEYHTSADFKLSDKPRDYQGVPAALEFPGAQFMANPGALVALVDMPPASRMNLTSTMNNTNTYTVYSDYVALASLTPTADGKTQTFQAPLSPPGGTRDDNPKFCLGVPPGSGSITITKISIAPGTMAGGMPARP